MNLRDGDGRYGQFLELLPEDLLGGGAILQETEFKPLSGRRLRKLLFLRSPWGSGAWQCPDPVPNQSVCPQGGQESEIAHAIEEYQPESEAAENPSDQATSEAKEASKQPCKQAI